jgi:hypothetical protein
MPMGFYTIVCGTFLTNNLVLIAASKIRRSTIGRLERQHRLPGALARRMVSTPSQIVLAAFSAFLADE